MARTRKTPEQVVALLQASGALPSDHDVDSQGFRFFPRHWLNKWDATSTPKQPRILGNEGLDARGRKRLTRQDLFRLGQGIKTAADAVEFYVAVCSWGVGVQARDVYRRIPPLAHPQAAERLLRGIREVQGTRESALAGYRAFVSADISYIKGLGPAFFTKLLYFAAGEPTTEQDGHPLILDQKVAKAIGWPAKTWWTPVEYRDYLELVDHSRRLLAPVRRADCIEFALFSPAAQKLVATAAVPLRA